MICSLSPKRIRSNPTYGSADSSSLKRLSRALHGVRPQEKQHCAKAMAVGCFLLQEYKYTLPSCFYTPSIQHSTTTRNTLCLFFLKNRPGEDAWCVLYNKDEDFRWWRVKLPLRKSKSDKFLWTTSFLWKPHQDSWWSVVCCSKCLILAVHGVSHSLSQSQLEYDYRWSLLLSSQNYSIGVKWSCAVWNPTKRSRMKVPGGLSQKT